MSDCDFMDNREKRIAFAWMAIEAKKERKEKFRKLRQPTNIKYPLLFCISLSLFTLVVAFLAFVLRR